MGRIQMMQDEEQRKHMLDMQHQNPWGKFLVHKLFVEELSDHENMIDENQLEPDYYIDRPVIYKA